MQIRTPAFQNRFCRRAGFTLAEVLIATAIVGISFLSLYSGLVQGERLIQNSQQNKRASEIMAQQMETLRLYTWDQLTNSSYIPTSNNFSVQGLP